MCTLDYMEQSLLATAQHVLGYIKSILHFYLGYFICVHQSSVKISICPSGAATILFFIVASDFLALSINPMVCKCQKIACCNFLKNKVISH